MLNNGKKEKNILRKNWNLIGGKGLNGKCQNTLMNSLWILIHIHTYTHVTEYTHAPLKPRGNMSSLFLSMRIINSKNKHEKLAKPKWSSSLFPETLNKFKLEWNFHHLLIYFPTI